MVPSIRICRNEGVAYARIFAQNGKPRVLWPGDVDPGAVVEPLVMLAE
jgi:hypothetical protein